MPLIPGITIVIASTIPINKKYIIFKKLLLIFIVLSIFIIPKKVTIKKDINVDEYLGLAEKLFMHKGKKGHQMIQLYKVSIDNKNLKEEYPILDDDVTAKWIDIEDIISGKKIVYPEIVADYIKKLI